MQGCEGERRRKACRKVNCRHQFIHSPRRQMSRCGVMGSTARINNRTSQFKARKIGKIIIESERKIGCGGKLEKCRRRKN